MKKIKLFLVAAAFIGIGSAFTATRVSPGEYVLIGGTFQLVDNQPPGGHCDIQTASICKYEKIGNAGPDPYTNPANFSALDADKVWVP